MGDLPVNPPKGAPPPLTGAVQELLERRAEAAQALLNVLAQFDAAKTRVARAEQALTALKTMPAQRYYVLEYPGFRLVLEATVAARTKVREGLEAMMALALREKVMLEAQVKHVSEEVKEVDSKLARLGVQVAMHP